ncbi:MAG: hypothetical protein PHQ22_02665 [Sulfuricurvum sp.]|nr:hypothetical protein [Sulfuricurvum sp.]MDD5386077.1 hypothetical protein [Sulfuricurvum sp.]
MNYEEYAGKSVLLLGKTRSLNGVEFEVLLKLHSMSVVKQFDETVALIIEGKMMNPLELQESERIYESHTVPIVDIGAIEKWLCGSIEPNRLLMSLKLSRDQDRLVNFLQNPYITDELFFKLLKLYDWQGEGLFDNDTNRDVTAAIIGRFYIDLERNHNVQYAMSGLAHLVEKYGNSQLIMAISELSPIAKELKNSNDRSLSGVLDAMALHSDTPKSLLQLLLKERAYLLAHREPLVLEKELLALEDETILRSLAHNVTLSQEGADSLEQQYPELIASFYPLDEIRFERLMGESIALASNPSLTPSMQERLMEMNKEAVFSALAQNTALRPEHLETLFVLNQYGEQLASNASLFPEYLERLYQNASPNILRALASNTSTPVEILYQLSLDQRTERAVKTNPAFGKHIQTYNLGWN